MASMKLSLKYVYTLGKHQIPFLWIHITGVKMLQQKKGTLFYRWECNKGATFTSTLLFGRLLLTPHLVKYKVKTLDRVYALTRLFGQGYKLSTLNPKQKDNISLNNKGNISPLRKYFFYRGENLI